MSFYPQDDFMQPNTNTKLLLYTECAAAISSSLSRKADGSTLFYYEAIGGFPGIWKLSARAGIALQDALNRLGDPDTKDVNFVELVGGMVGYLLAIDAEPGDDDLRQKAEELIEQSDEE
jgi:hypothetical protein